jgi:secreted trypsin-like serine protease
MKKIQIALVSMLLFPACAMPEADEDVGGDDVAADDVGVDEQEIVGGSPEQARDAPWIVSIRAKTSGNHFCGGAILDEWNVVTARHCLNVQDNRPKNLLSPSLIQVLAGASKTTQKGGATQLVDVADVLPLDDDFNTDFSVGSDIIVLRLAKPLEWTKTVKPIEPARLADEAAGLLAPGKIATVTGFGRTSTDGPPGEKLRTVDVPIVPLSVGEEVIGHELALDLMAAGGVEAEDSCFGDSGGPLTVKKGGKTLLAGVVSGGATFECGAAGAPGLYTRLAAFADVIDETLCFWPDVIKKKDHIAGSKNQLQFVKVEVPAGLRMVNFHLSGGTGDSDLFVRKGKKPTETEFDCVSGIIGTNGELCHFFEPTPGTYWVGVIGNNDFANVKLRVKAYSH